MPKEYSNEEYSNEKEYSTEQTSVPFDIQAVYGKSHGSSEILINESKAAHQGGVKGIPQGCAGGTGLATFPTPKSSHGTVDARAEAALHQPDA